MPAYGYVRRVLAYVVPDPAAGSPPPDATKKLREDVARPPIPPLGEVALASLVTIPATQSIAAQLDALRAQNADIGKHRRTLSTIVANTEPDLLALTARALFETYRQRRIDGLIDSQLAALEKTAASASTRSSPRRRRPPTLYERLDARAQRQAVAARGLAEPTEDHAPWDPFIPTTLAELDTDPASGRWRWGQYTMQFLVSILFDLMRRTQRLRHITGEADPAPFPLRGASASSEHPAATDWESRDIGTRSRRNQTRGAKDTSATLVHDDVLSELWRRAYAVNAVVELLPEGAGSEALAGELLEHLRKGTAGAADESLARTWLRTNLLEMRVDAEREPGRPLVDVRERRLAQAAQSWARSYATCSRKSCAWSRPPARPIYAGIPRRRATSSSTTEPISTTTARAPGRSCVDC